MHTTQTEGAGQIELGATWLHGIKGHPAYDLAIERGLISPADKQRASKTFLAIFSNATCHPYKHLEKPQTLWELPNMHDGMMVLDPDA